MRISLAQARRIISAAFEVGDRNGYQPLSVAVLDSGGHLIAFERQDGSSIGRFEIAFGKAYGAISLGVGSRALMTRAETQPHFVSSVTAAIGGSLVPVPGGVLVRGNAGLIGAVGVTGDLSDNDEICAIAGIEAAGFEADCG